MKQTRPLFLVAVAAIAALGAACTKKVAVATPPAAPAAAPARTAARASTPARRPAAAPVRSAAAAPAPRYPSAATRARIDELLAKIEDATLSGPRR